MRQLKQTPSALRWTGERYVPGVEGDVAIEHLHRYALARELVRGKDVLDIASGEGYGTWLLGDTARFAIGIDAAEEAVRHAHLRYARPKLHFAVGSCADIPLKDGTVDVVVSFETIEHSEQHEEMLREIKRVLRPGGTLIISSPDKRQYSDIPGYNNPFHVRELYLDEFRDLLKGQFRHIALYGQRVCRGSLIAPLDASAVPQWRTFSGEAEDIQGVAGIDQPLYFLAIASDAPPVSIPAGIFVDPQLLLPPDQRVLELEQSISLLQQGIASSAKSVERETVRRRKAEIWASEQQGALQELASTLRGTIADRERQIVALNQVALERNARIDSLASTLRHNERQLAALADGIAQMVSSTSWRLTKPLRIVRRLLDRLRDAQPSSAERSPMALSPEVERSTNSGTRTNGMDRNGFDAEMYLSLYPDIRDQYGHDPYEHFVLYGRAEGRIAYLPPPAPVDSPDTDVAGAGFDPNLYLKLYPDVHARFRAYPYAHFLAYGRAEGRVASMPRFEYFGSFEDLDPQKETVLVVSHEASRTGAPVLSLSIARAFMKKHNVVVMLLGGGSIVNLFRESADVVVGPIGPIGRAPGLVTAVQTSRLLAKCKFKFAIVNSVESRDTLQELARQFVPSVSLIHEFASNTRPRDGIEKAAFWATETIFSAAVVREDAVSACPPLADRLPLVIPQGKCELIDDVADPSVDNVESERLRQTFRPNGWPDDTIVVLGVGSVSMRKGVDLFVSCAARVQRSAGERALRFVWIGAGYDPNNDMAYSLYLEDQIRRANLSDRFAFMEETTRIDMAYDAADVLILSSRLDPLPNVALDSMSHGLPFVCFDRATGAADILKDNGLADTCVAPYLDVEGMASRVIEFINNPALRESVGTRMKEAAQRIFHMPTYLEKLEKIALQCVERSAREHGDYAVIADSGLIDSHYVAGPDGATMQPEEAARKFVRAWAMGWFLRKPFAGFHPGIYAEQCAESSRDSNPFAEYLRDGMPAGPWLSEVINPAVSVDAPAPLALSVALHLHLFHAGLGQTMIDRLKLNRFRPDLFITVPSRQIQEEIGKVVSGYAGKVIDIQIVPNRGRDIGAFLTAFGRTMPEYEFVGHFHSKSTVHRGDTAMGKNWFAFLLENLLGGRYAMGDIILARMAADPSIGLVFPDDPNVVGWSENRPLAIPLAARLGIGELRETHFNFPVGTMFWARRAALQSLIDLKLDWSDYPSEPLPDDGTMLHAIERLLPFVVKQAGFRSVLTSIPGVTR